MAIRAGDMYRVTRDDYLTGELLATVKSEWVNGVVYDVAGATKTHGQIVSRIGRLLFDNVEALGCVIVAADLLVETADAYYYPDVVVSCQPDDDARIEHNPCFIAEVLSPSTKRVDQHEKRHAYCALPSLRDYWIVDPDTNVIEVWVRTPDGWVGEHRAAADPVGVQCLDVTLRVVDIVGI
jgi:Uma2 family endonuclease